jgi:signal transduction histidine kinase
MTASFRNFRDWLRRLEERGDLWASKRMTAAEYGEAKAFDVKLKRYFWRWLAGYVAVGLVGAALVRVGAPKVGWGEAIAVSYLMCLGLLLLTMSAWFRHSKFVGPKARRNFALLVLGMFGGGLVGAFVASFNKGQSLLDMPPEKIRLMLTTVSVIAVAIVVSLGTLAWLRDRHVRGRLAAVEAEADRERLERQRTQAELKLLQAQVEPHFLFNTLANLRVLVQTDPAQAVVMLDHLIHYLRTSLPEIRAESSTVGREIDLARAYLEILRIRMGGALAIDASTPADLAQKPFPPMMLLTLVENAIKHGIAPIGSGSIRVVADECNGRLRMTVEDDGRGLAGTIGHGVGLTNLRERLSALFGDRAQLSLSARSGGGTIATIEVPL